jgi:hypothetical protein
VKYSDTRGRTLLKHLREEIVRCQALLDMAGSMGHSWAVPYLEEQLKTTEELLASVAQTENEDAA